MDFIDSMDFIPQRAPSSLDQPLAYWSPSDPWTMRDACANTLIVGKTGSGKSSGAGDYCLRAVVRYPNSGGVIFAAKPEDKAYVQRVFREERTLSDLFILEPEGAARFNVLDYERAKGADVRDLSQACMTFKETLERTEGAGGGGGSGEMGYWASQQRMMLHNAIQVLLLATGRIDPWELQCFITGAAISYAEIGDPAWQRSFHYQMLQEARTKAVTGREQHDYELAEQYWISQLPRLNDRTRSSIEAGVYNTLHAMNTGIARELLATTTTLSPELLEQRKWILVNAPIAPGDVTSSVINTAVKYAVQRHILKRKAGADDPLLCIFSDEFQKLANSYDAKFLAECRSHKGCLIALTQSVHALYANLHGKGGEHETDALLTNFGQVVVHTLGDAKSARQWSELLGNQRELFISTTTTPNGDALFDLLMGRVQVSVSAAERYEPYLQPSTFLRDLRQGGPESGNWVDGVVIRSGTPFRHSGANFLLTSFRQR
jgi:hypothetical protein